MMLLSSYITSVLIITVFATISSGNIELTVLRGVPSSLRSKYAQLKSFACLDGSLTIPFEYVNDDYCDCRDGSDEPGTSACPNGRFFCENKGYIGTSIPSHLVGDGICVLNGCFLNGSNSIAIAIFFINIDCCDGSDEYETSVVCNNTCFELAQKSRAEQEARRALHEVGVAKKKDIMAKSIAAVSARKVRLLELEQELRTIENELKEKEALKQLAEAPENEAKEKHQKLWDEQRAIREAIAHDNQMREMFADIDTNNDSLDLRKQADVDVGPHGEYAAFMDHCFDYDEREYTYRVCMFKDAKQISKGGGSDVTIGYWDAWTGPSDNKYLKMKYANGATCWNGPARSLTITFQCGVDHKVIDVREPTRCEYAMLFETPSACDETIATTIVHPNHEEF
ncbi:unnamed protein product [Rotaria magnacalcarata]|uniref:Glucosidase 2 subunit beta n=1 Tax=Rotaria magnacalcarata TaxID=392030 RepID=A0A8S2JUA6_9BILA|nr:unnamed protein product [Rotaria magnacalcarata]